MTQLCAHSWGIPTAIILLLAASGCTEDHSAQRLPIGNVERPLPSQTLTGASVQISGWALADKGVDRIDAYWDDSLAASSKTGDSRPDVQKVYPNYPDAAQAGFTFSADLSGLSPGPHMLTVQVRSRDDAVRELFRFPETVSR